MILVCAKCKTVQEVDPPKWTVEAATTDGPLVVVCAECFQTVVAEGRVSGVIKTPEMDA